MSPRSCRLQQSAIKEVLQCSLGYMVPKEKMGVSKGEDGAFGNYSKGQGRTREHGARAQLETVSWRNSVEGMSGSKANL